MGAFKGFPEKMIDFYDELEQINSKRWFDEHKGGYEEFVKRPACDFVSAMGEKLLKIAPGIHAEPKVNRSLFRINRDVRFSKDKRPYKTTMGIWFWEGDGKRMECSGYYFQYGAGKVMFGAGMYMMPKEMLDRYRLAVVDEKLGKSLRAAVKKVRAAGYTVGPVKYKKTPRGFDKEHPNAEFLLYGGLTAMYEMPLGKEFYSAEILDIAFEHFKNMKPVHEWLKKVFKSV